MKLPIEDQIEMFEQEIARLQEEYKTAYAMQFSDPKSALVKARDIAEGICKQMYKRHTAEEAAGKQFNQLLSCLISDRILPAYIAPHFRTIQSYGNVGAHFLGRDAIHITIDYTEPCLSVLPKINGSRGGFIRL